MPALATLTIAALVDRSGVEAKAIESYQRLGLLSKPRRTIDGLLLYPPDEVDRVVFIRRALDLGFSAEAIAEMIGLGCRKLPTCSDVHDIAQRQLADVRRRRADLERIEQVLAPLVENCPRAAARGDCNIIAALSHHIPGKARA
jgi:MerR family mercuric resistance operon transcriptional regulator